MKRFQPSIEYIETGIGVFEELTMTESENGGFVRYEDYQKLVALFSDVENGIISNLDECPLCDGIVKQTFEGLFLKHDADCPLYGNR